MYKPSEMILIINNGSIMTKVGVRYEDTTYPKQVCSSATGVHKILSSFSF